MSRDDLALEGLSLSHSFAEGQAKKPVLEDVSIELARGELTLVMGPSGSGKTTLLGILAGLLRPEAGTVRALGVPLWEVSEARRRAFRLQHCGFVFQGHNLFPALTACQQLEIVLRWGQGYRGRRVRQEAEEMLGRLGLEGKHFDQHPLALSGGEKQRVAIGRALIKRPDLCFADEPTAALDWDNGANVAGLLRAASRAGTAVLVISHDGRLRQFADRVYHLEDGRLRQAAEQPSPVPGGLPVAAAGA
jgi:putative ABC transport system ATP-binding protein